MGAALLLLAAGAAGAEPIGGIGQSKAVLRQAVAPESWRGAGAFGLAALAIWPMDDPVVDEFTRREPLGSRGRDIGYRAGHRTTVAATIVGLTAGGLLAGDPYIRDTGILLAQAHLLSASVTQAIKYGAGRTRPDASNDRSMPSGHASGAWTSALLLHERFGPRLGVPALVAASYVGLSRIQGNKHHPSDVLVGFALGHWAVRSVMRSVENDDGDRFSIAPARAPDGRRALALRLRF